MNDRLDLIAVVKTYEYVWFMNTVSFAAISTSFPPFLPHLYLVCLPICFLKSNRLFPQIKLSMEASCFLYRSWIFIERSIMIFSSHSQCTMVYSIHTCVYHTSVKHLCTF